MTPPRTQTADTPQEEVKGETLLWRYAKRSEGDDGSRFCRKRSERPCKILHSAKDLDVGIAICIVVYVI